MKLNLGAGTDIRPEYVNHDIAKLPGIEVCFNLNTYPWPWEDNSFEEIVANDLIEHLDDFLLAMNEIHRILSLGGVISLTVPYWNSCYRYIDPTHKYGFHEDTFKFFDPTSHYCQDRHYYTSARFSIEKELFLIAPFIPYFWIPGMKEIKIKNSFAKRIIGFIGNIFLSNLILGLQMEMRKLKSSL
jgi:SAM-dependent methyltransferase